MHPLPVRRFAFFALSALVVAGCSDSTVKKVQPSLSVSTDSVDFGLEAVSDSSIPYGIQLKSNTGAPVAITNLTVTTTVGGGDVFTLDASAPAEVPARGTVELGVVFTPLAVTTYTVELKFNTDDPEHPEVRILLSGEGKSPQVEVSPLAINLAATACPQGASSVQCKDEASISIENKGLVRLTLPSVAVVAADGETAVPANLKLARLVNTKSLEPGEKLDVTVVWQPRGDIDSSKAQTGEFHAQLRITTNDPESEVVTVPITATGNPAGVPQSCINILSVMQREYKNGAVSFKAVPPSVWLDDGNPPNPALIHVRPGMKLTFTSKRTKPVIQDGVTTGFIVDTAEEQANPCTFDPTGDRLTPSWSTNPRPAQSRAAITAKSAGTEGEIEIDAAGEYVIGLAVANTLNLRGTATFTVDAQPRDDLFVQLDWQDSPGVDLDLHLLADEGPGLSVPASLFCAQDCFFFNPNPTWFTQSTGDMIPRFLRDDQGSAAQLEAVDLIKAPEGSAGSPVPSSYRVVVHYYDTNGQTTEVRPTVTIRHLDLTFPAITASAPLTKQNDTWVAARVTFAGDGTAPTVTALSEPIVTREPPDLTSGNLPVCE